MVEAPERPAVSAGPDPRVVAVLSGSEASAERSLALRTRRAVYNAARDSRAERQESKRHLSIALLAGGTLAIMLMPAIWSGIEDMVSGAAVTDLPVMLGALGITLCAAVAAVLFLLAGRDGTREIRRFRR